MERTYSWIDYFLYMALGVLVAFLLFGHLLMHSGHKQKESTDGPLQTELV